MISTGCIMWPSSTFVDYIQEIGRAARDTDIHGISATDYHERDFYYMKRLHMAGNILHRNSCR